MGIMGVSMNIGASMFPPLGSYLTVEFSTDIMFYVSSALALISIMILMGLKETLSQPQRFHPRLLKLKADEIIEFKALPIALVTICVYMSFGVLLTISPDQGDFLGMTYKGMLFTSFTFCAILSRLFAGKVSDRMGRVPVIKFSILLVSLSLVFLGQADSENMLMLASGALGFTTGIAAPAVFAWVIDISPDNRRGRYMATVYIALEIGIGFGAILSAWLYGNNHENFALAYNVAAVFPLIAGAYLQFWWKGE